MILPHASSALISAEFLVEERGEGGGCWRGGSLQFIESHGSDLVLEGILVSHSPSDMQSSCRVLKRKSLHTLFATWCILIPQISASVAYRQTLLLALETVQRYTVSINSRHHLASRFKKKKKKEIKHPSWVFSLHFFFFFFFLFPFLHIWPGFLQMDREKIRAM